MVAVMHCFTQFVICVLLPVSSFSKAATRFGVARPVGANSNNNDEDPSDLTLATYNIWNIMFHWEVRKLHIADMIDTHDIDIVGFQEVRAHRDSQHNQLHDLQELLPKYKWILYHPTRSMENSEKQPPGWEIEGIGILSKHRILSYHVMNLTNGQGEDKTQRAALSAQISVDSKDVSVVVTHFSYDRNDQCKNAWDVLKYLHSARADKTIILGDFNTYNDYYWPVQLISTGNVDGKAPPLCKREHKPWFHGHTDFEFTDAWPDLHSQKPGFTFSNMPEPGFQSRPDRILISKPGFKINSVFTLGQGFDYKRDYKHKLFMARLQSVYDSAQHQLEGQLYESACYWDCGPHGMCRCGICVEKKEDDCDETYCSSCGPARLRYYQFLQTAFIVLLVLLIFSSFIIISKFTLHDIRMTFLGKLQRSVFINKYFIFALVLGMIGDFMFFKWNYSDVLELVNSQLPEEFFPSDHLMVVVRVTLD